MTIKKGSQGFVVEVGDGIEVPWSDGLTPALIVACTAGTFAVSFGAFVLIANYSEPSRSINGNEYMFLAIALFVIFPMAGWISFYAIGRNAKSEYISRKSSEALWGLANDITKDAGNVLGRWGENQRRTRTSAASIHRFAAEPGTGADRGAVVVEASWSGPAGSVFFVATNERSSMFRSVEELKAAEGAGQPTNIIASSPSPGEVRFVDAEVVEGRNKIYYAWVEEDVKIDADLALVKSIGLNVFTKSLSVENVLRNFEGSKTITSQLYTANCAVRFSETRGERFDRMRENVEAEQRYERAQKGDVKKKKSKKTAPTLKDMVDDIVGKYQGASAKYDEAESLVKEYGLSEELEELVLNEVLRRLETGPDKK